MEDFPEQLEEFAKDIKTFLKSLNEFPEFTDEAVNNSMNAFEADLKVRSGPRHLCLICELRVDGVFFIVLGVLLEDI